MGRVTLKDVAKKADVSYQTVSKVLNGKAFISTTTEARIWDAIKELNYQPNIAARNLRTQKSNLIGFSWSPRDALNPIVDRFLYSTTRTLQDEGYHVLMFPNDEAKANRFWDLYYTGQVSGYVLTSTDHDDSRVAELIDQNIPFATFGRANDDWEFNWVDIDGQYGIELVVDHLHSKQHEKIALFTWAEGSRAGEDRERGYFNQMQKMGTHTRPDWVVRMDGTVEAGYRSAQAILNLPENDRPTAIVCVSDILAIGAMNVIAAAGLQVGKDIAVTGYDNIPMTEFLHPPLTTVQQPVEAAGERVARMLLTQIDNKEASKEQALLRPNLVIRASA
ncbi:MAG: LacI family DNA-binding transcriptional regulator [Chloroflexota bacterium]